MKKTSPVLYLNYSSYMTLGILRSQVGVPLKILGVKGIKFILISSERLSDYLNKSQKIKIKNDLQKSNVDIRFLPKFIPKYLQVVPGWVRKGTFILPFIFDIIFFLFYTFCVILFNKVRIVHTRSYVPAAVALIIKKILNIKVIFDPRGIIPEELQVAKGWSSNDWKYRFWKRLEKWILVNSDLTFAVSENFREHLLKINNKHDVLVTPCCVNTSLFYYDKNKREECRVRRGIQNNFVVFYSLGCFVPYQVTDEAVEFFRIVSELIPEALFWICTPDTKQVENYLRKRNMMSDTIKIFSADFAEMPEINLCADIGLMVRHTSIISKVASPVKFAEYLASGLPVAAYPEIGDTEAIINKNKIGMIIYPGEKEKNKTAVSEFLKYYSDNKESIKEQCSKTAQKELSLDRVTSLYEKVYNDLQ